MVINKLFVRIFTGYCAFSGVSLALAGYFACKGAKTRFLQLLMENSEMDAIRVGQMANMSLSVFFPIVLIFIGIVVAGFVFFKKNLSPLKHIAEIAQSFERGDFSQRTESIPSGDFEDLSRAINTIGKKLQFQTQTIVEDENKLNAIMANMHDAIIVTDLEERILLINNAARNLFGIQMVLLNKDFLWEKIRNESLCNLVREIIQSQSIKTSEIEVSTPEKRLLQTHLSSVRIDKNKQGVLIVFHDITELRKLENTRREFVANVSHELRTPLASIKGYVETLLEDSSAGHTQDCLSIIMKHTKRLDNLIKDILELSRLDTSGLNIEFHTLDLHPSLDAIISTYREHCVEKELTFLPDVSSDLPVLETNEYLLRQLLTNLMDNAIKYTPKGGQIGLKVESVNEGIRFKISDTGIGIPQEHISRIFERFYRVDSARSRELGGTGLGLSIVKHIVNLHHGHINLESMVGVGSKFVITLPRRQPEYAA
ncbi:MAG: ATP-binding protein [Candidatus Brocadiaceae bacterium]|nr:ATP-binding protein [Candidatus Brocadiaceae bacterium]